MQNGIGLADLAGVMHPTRRRPSIRQCAAQLRFSPHFKTDAKAPAIQRRAARPWRSGAREFDLRKFSVGLRKHFALACKTLANTPRSQSQQRARLRLVLRDPGVCSIDSLRSAAGYLAILRSLRASTRPLAEVTTALLDAIAAHALDHKRCSRCAARLHKAAGPLPSHHHPNTKRWGPPAPPTTTNLRARQSPRRRRRLDGHGQDG